MNKTFNINLGSYPFAIDEDAYNYIQNYLDTIRKHFSTSEGCDEILYDIEVRMAELFQEHLKGRAIISMKELDEVVMVMGKPEDFGAEPMDETAHTSSSRKRKKDFNINTGKRLFRDPDDKHLGGVCSGIAAYLGIEDPLWIRLIFALFFFVGAGVVTYIILWILVPKAESASDKLAMRGEPTTIENIAKVVETELSELGDKINEWSKDLGSKKKSSTLRDDFRGKSFIAGGVNMFGKIVGSIVPIFRTVVKPFFMFFAILILSVLGISWAVSVIAASLSAPLLIFMGPSSTFLGYLGIVSILILFGIPLLGIMLSIARAVFGYRVHKHVKMGLWTLWFLAIFTGMFAGVSTIKDYSTEHEFSSMTDYNIEGSNINIKMSDESTYQRYGMKFGNLFIDNNDKWGINHVTIKVEKSKDNLVHIEKRISGRGHDSQDAQQNALFVTNDVVVKDNEITISKYLTIPKNKKYRNQSVYYTLYIPEGKELSFDRNTKNSMSESSLFSWDKIYSDIDKMSWNITSKGISSKGWEDLHNHKKEIAIGGFSKIIIERGFDVVIKKGDKPNVSFDGNKELIEQIEHKNLDGSLSIKTELEREIEDVKIIITTPVLDLVYLDGIMNAKIEGFNQDQLKIVSRSNRNGSNKGKIELLGKIKELDISLDGDQTLEMTGEGEKMDINCSNGAVVKAGKYMLKHVNFMGQTNRESSIHVTETLTCENPENVSFDVIGNPQRIKK